MVMTKVAQLRGRDPPDEDAGEDSDAGSGADARSDEDEPAVFTLFADDQIAIEALDFCLEALVRCALSRREDIAERDVLYSLLPSSAACAGTRLQKGRILAKAWSRTSVVLEVLECLQRGYMVVVSAPDDEAQDCVSCHQALLALLVSCSEQLGSGSVQDDMHRQVDQAVAAWSGVSMQDNAALLCSISSCITESEEEYIAHTLRQWAAKGRGDRRPLRGRDFDDAGFPVTAQRAILRKLTLAGIDKLPCWSKDSDSQSCSMHDRRFALVKMPSVPEFIEYGPATPAPAWSVQLHEWLVNATHVVRGLQMGLADAPRASLRSEVGEQSVDGPELEVRGRRGKRGRLDTNGAGDGAASSETGPHNNYDWLSAGKPHVDNGTSHGRVFLLICGGVGGDPDENEAPAEFLKVWPGTCLD